MRTLFRMLTSDAIVFPSEAMITTLEYVNEVSEYPFVEICGSSTRRIKCKIQDRSGTLVVSMITLPKINNNSSEELNHICETPNHQNSSHDVMTFTVESILAFVDDVKDTNSIHRKAPYIVPGCLLLEKIWQYVNQLTLVHSINIRFLSPVRANEVVTLEHDEQHVIGKVEDTIVFKVIYKEESHE